MGKGSEREDVEVNGVYADDMTPFLEQLQGGEGGDLHEVRFVQQEKRWICTLGKMERLGGGVVYRGEAGFAEVPVRRDLLSMATYMSPLGSGRTLLLYSCLLPGSSDASIGFVG